MPHSDNELLTEGPEAFSCRDRRSPTIGDATGNKIDPMVAMIGIDG